MNCLLLIGEKINFWSISEAEQPGDSLRVFSYTTQVSSSIAIVTQRVQRKKSQNKMLTKPEKQCLCYSIALFKNTRNLKLKSQPCLRFSLLSIILEDLSGNRALLKWVQKVMVCDLGLVNFDPFCQCVSVFQDPFLVIVIMIDGSGKRNCKDYRAYSHDVTAAILM